MGIRDDYVNNMCCEQWSVVALWVQITPSKAECVEILIIIKGGYAMHEISLEPRKLLVFFNTLQRRALQSSFARVNHRLNLLVAALNRPSMMNEPVSKAKLILLFLRPGSLAPNSKRAQLSQRDPN